MNVFNKIYLLTLIQRIHLCSPIVSHESFPFSLSFALFCFRLKNVCHYGWILTESLSNFRLFSGRSNSFLIYLWLPVHSNQVPRIWIFILPTGVSVLITNKQNQTKKPPTHLIIIITLSVKQRNQIQGLKFIPCGY